MWSDFYRAGGWGMHPVSLFGFLLIAVSALHALRPDARYARLVVTLGIVTFGSGLLGTATGIGNSFHFIMRVAPEKQLEIALLGVAESLHDVVLALMLVILGGLITAVGIVRSSRASAAAAG